MTSLESEVRRTGIDGLDETLQGGIPEGHVVLLRGKAGTGKTILSMQWLFEGHKKFDESGIYIAATEPFEKALQNMHSLDFFDEDSLKEGNIKVTDLRSIMDTLGIDGSGDVVREDVDRLVDVIKDLVEDYNAKRLVIDSITAAGLRFDDKGLFRDFIFRLGTVLSGLGCTTFLISEKEYSSRFEVEDFISDGIIELDYVSGERKMVRSLNVLKMRGVDYKSGEINFNITSNGVCLYPKIIPRKTIAETDFEDRKGTGVEELDKMLDGGYPEGHNIILSGNTGTGKSTLAMQFLVEGMKNGEPALFVNLEEPTPQIRSIAKSHGWDFEKYMDEGLLEFITPNLIDTYPDRFLHDVRNVVDAVDVERMVVDSVSSIPSADMSEDDLRELLLELNSILKPRGITCIMTHMARPMFGDTSDSHLSSMKSGDLRLSSLTDGIILLRYIEEGNEVNKSISVLKMRGSTHSKKIRRFEILDEGIEVGEVVG